ncbi:MAG: S46 family peptidase [Haliscomenobacter sp.]|nr:S46 family peptidase [Haliscomenobacter sp.]
MKRILWILLFFDLISGSARAGEGMWLPLLLQQNEAEMQRMGMKMTAEDIYSINKGSLKDAIVRFGGGCTGSLISSTGLVLTNHHCGFGQIQYHSSLENNYLEQGFWAKTLSEELPNPGLGVTFIVRIEDVTAKALAGLTDGLAERERQAQIDRNIQALSEQTPRETWQEVSVRPFFQGNAYYLFVTETFRDVRLVGAPPGAVGKFGADTDNWVWPRHTGDFSIFRVYADKNNRPAAYAPDNVPYKPKHYLPISLDGVAQGDFTLVFGFPGTTREYLPSSAVQQLTETLNPIRIGIRDRSLAIIDEAMRSDPQIRIQYASKQANLANSWKKWIGESLGIKTVNGIEQKKSVEAEFMRRVNAQPQWKTAYGTLLPNLETLYKEIEPYAKSRDYITEIASTNVELLRFANTLHQFVVIYDNNGAEALKQRKEQLRNAFVNFYKDYRPEVDQRVFAALADLYFTKLPAAHLSSYATEQMNFAGKNAAEFARILFYKSHLAQAADWAEKTEADPVQVIRLIKEDYAYQLVRNILETGDLKVFRPYNEIQDKINLLQRTYMKALMEVLKEKRFYPDANSTLRVTYGKVEGYQPKDGVFYVPFTYLDGVMEKFKPGDYEFDVPEKLRQLHASKDYGPYGENGKLPVCFLGSNHTTGGNSGSPAIDAQGNLVGLNFDRVWEGTMSDILYSPAICRNIMVDIRYVLFMVDKYAGASHLVKEMKLVHPKKKG